MRSRAPILVVCCAALVGCAREPEPFAPPFQRRLGTFTEPPLPQMGAFMRFTDVNADEYVAGGIQPNTEGTGWRWTFERPQLRFKLDRLQPWKFSAFFGFPAANFKDTGPVTVSFWINGKLLDRVRYTKPGDYLYEKRVPAPWLTVNEFNQVAMEIAPPWIAPADKVKLGFVLHRAGFVKP